MNNPSYLGTEIQYFHFNHIVNMDSGYHGGRVEGHLDELNMLSVVSINDARDEAARDVVRQLTGMPQPKEECNEW